MSFVRVVAIARGTAGSDSPRRINGIEYVVVFFPPDASLRAYIPCHRPPPIGTCVAWQNAENGATLSAFEVVDPDLVKGWKRDESAPFEGWDFSHLKDRTREEREPWDYLNLARDLVAESESVLDMGTGGGERFAALAPFHGRAVALEGFEPNVTVARGRLHPLGVSVIEADESSTLPFDNGAFDLVLNRHSAFLADEVRRVLKPGGRFLTQQVGGDDLHDLAALFDSGRIAEAWSLTEAGEVIENSGLVVSHRDEWRGVIEFLDVGAIAYLLRAVPWIVADFSVDRYESRLDRLQRRLDMGKPLRFTRTSFIVQAHAPSP